MHCVAVQVEQRNGLLRCYPEQGVMFSPTVGLRHAKAYDLSITPRFVETVPQMKVWVPRMACKEISSSIG